MHCLSSSGRRDPDELTTAEAMSVVDQLAALQVFYVNMGGGEPMLRRDFFDIVEYSVDNNVGVKFSTNGTHLDADAARRLASMNYLDVQISLDGMDPATYNAYRFLALRSPENALLGWHARGVRLDAPAFRLLGVRALALAAPLDEPGWELFAGPGVPGAEAECFLYRATDPLPRAFCVPAVVSPEELKRRHGLALDGWDPRAVACVSGDARPGPPFVEAEVGEPSFEGNNLVRVRANLVGGEGLLVLTEQHFPGWSVEVDGEPAELLNANALFRGVLLGPGDHEVVFRYRPWSAIAGALLSLLALIALAALLFADRRPREGA